MNQSDVQHFLMPEPQDIVSIEAAHFVVLPFPLEKTTSYVQGTSQGPQAILDASSQVEWFDAELQTNILEAQIATDLTLMQPHAMDRPVEDILKQAQSIVQTYLEQGKFVLTLGGEHTISAAVAKPWLDHFKSEVTVLHIDAHADLKDTYEGSKYSHACAIRRLVDQSPILSVGIRSVDEEEFQFAKNNDLIQTWYSHDIAQRTNWIDEVIDAIQTPFVYITCDVDGLDPSIMPATGTPQPGGLLWHDTLTLFRRASQKAKIISADVNELCPLPNHHASTFLAAKLCNKIIGYTWAQR